MFLVFSEMMETVSAVSKYFHRSNSTLMAWTRRTPRVSDRFAPGPALQISSDGDDRMGTKIKTKINPWAKLTPPPPPHKVPGPNFRALKTTAANQVWFYFTRITMRPGYGGTSTNLQIVLNNQNIPT